MYKAKQLRELDGIRSNRTKAQEKDKIYEVNGIGKVGISWGISRRLDDPR